MRADFAMLDDMPLDEIMRRWPKTVEVVMRHRMFCVGCAINPFHTITDACREHHVDEESFMREIGEILG